MAKDDGPAADRNGVFNVALGEEGLRASTWIRYETRKDRGARVLQRVFRKDICTLHHASGLGLIHVADTADVSFCSAQRHCHVRNNGAPHAS